MLTNIREYTVIDVFIYHRFRHHRVSSSGVLGYGPGRKLGEVADSLISEGYIFAGITDAGDNTALVTFNKNTSKVFEQELTLVLIRLSEVKQ